ncbi:type II toxin-antitoxin system MqsA family antitoxin [Oceanospirillum sediminis]|uniref:Type II toxin-antitoxin system MqsA family antitoxin n=1 Tax=Oceanospirillum sediminis TaxID=2760088 RepID=A0A839IRN1_9GAMM|nr:type II toxin-antitoxin system MqsA family antitoxin [Oceanospirillum sediminis]MBB1487149.1 type II toxin-antitoxin system MqsA family antitoxin [Oceanospirillum sediminis]
MKCPSCLSADLISATRDLPYRYRNEETLITNITGDFCPICGEVVLSQAESERISHIMLKTNQRIALSSSDK